MHGVLACSEGPLSFQEKVVGRWDWCPRLGGCPGLLELLGMGTESQRWPLGARPVSVRVAMPLGEQMVLLARCPPPTSARQPAGLGHSCWVLPRAGPRAGLGEVTAAAPRARAGEEGGAACRKALPQPCVGRGPSGFAFRTYLYYWLGTKESIQAVLNRCGQHLFLL